MTDDTFDPSDTTASSAYKLDDEFVEERDEFQRLIDVLILLRFERRLAEFDSSAFSALMDRLVGSLVAADKEKSPGARSFYAELAKRILQAEASWTHNGADKAA